MNTQNSSNIKVSIFQKVIWNIAGANVEILAQYPTQYHKYSAIGMTILMTSIAAFLSGSSAAWYFSKNIYATIAFGLFWWALIISIDRSLVITLKKDPDTKFGFFYYIIPFISRAVLAALVASMMSIPLELLIFDDFIQQEEVDWTQEQLLKTKGNNSHIDTKKEKEKDLSKVENDIKSNDNNVEKLEAKNKEIEETIRQKILLLDKPNSQEYKKAKSEKSRYEMKKSSLNRQKLELESNGESVTSIDEEIKSLNNKIIKAQKEINNEKVKWNKMLNDEITSLKSSIDLNKEKLDKLNDEKITLHDRKGNIDKAIEEAGIAIDSISKAKEAKINQSNDFIRKYRILSSTIYAKSIVQKEVPQIVEEQTITNYATFEVYKNEHELLLLWLVRILFFVVELLPTIVKIIAKTGVYERAIKSYETSINDYLLSDDYKRDRLAILNADLQQKALLTEYKNNAERTMQQDLIKKVVEAQERVAEQAIKNWENQYMATLNSVKITDENDSSLNNNVNSNNQNILKNNQNVNSSTIVTSQVSNLASGSTSKHVPNIKKAINIQIDPDMSSIATFSQDFTFMDEWD